MRFQLLRVRQFPANCVTWAQAAHGSREEHERTWKVGTHPGGATVDGIQDMVGNVAEWTATGDADSRVIRGGSYFSKANHLSTTAREDTRADAHRSYIGFRCAASLK